MDETLVIPILIVPLLNWNTVRIYFHSTVTLEDNIFLSLMFFLAIFESIKQLAVTCVNFEHFRGLYSTVVSAQIYTATQVAPLT